MKLFAREILNLPDCPVEFIGDETLLNQPIKQVLIDSRVVKPESIYIAIRGERLDGHRFVHSAFENGALAAIVDRSGLLSLDTFTRERGNFFVVKDTIYALQQLAHSYRQKFTIPVLGITGTSGKTTTKEMMGAILAGKYTVLKTAGNLNNHIGVPLTLFQLAPGVEIALIEMGTNHFGEIKRLTEIARPQYGLITNIGRGHLEFLGSLEGVARAKRELFDGLPANGTAFVNADDPWQMEKLPKVKKIVFYGIKNKADVRGTFLGINAKGETKFKVFNQEMTLQIPGAHQVSNALAALSVGLEFGLDLEQMKPLLENFKPHAKRMETIEKGGVLIFNDCYNANPDSLSAALETVKHCQVTGHKIAVLADMLELGATAEIEHRKMGQLIPQMQVDFVLGYGPFTAALIDEVKQTGQVKAMHFSDKSKLTVHLKSILQSGDLLLVKGSRGMALETVLDAVLNELE